MYVYMTLFVKMLLFNMLIGLMGASIARSKQDADAKKRLQMCGFLTDNWHMNAVEKKEEVVYIISCRQITVED
jgi:predicted branched-subunit amino acid permease